MWRWENQNQVVVWIWIGIGLFFLTTLFITLLIINYLKSIKKNKKKVAALVRNTKKEYGENMLSLQEQDRERLAEELHDNIISQLNIIRLTINEKSTEELSIDLKRSMQLVRELSHNLTPPDLSEIDLADLIADYLKQINKNIEIIFRHITVEIPISNPVKLNLFRIVQELITNILKHAEASRVDVSLRISINYLMLTIEDNGCGFIVSNHSGGIGLRNIQSRAQKIKAIYKLKTQPEKGTKFIACMAIQ
ncbi:ATP-binding protein [Chryseobacterium sp. Bi04]|uniref:sensor histidine kinase n=1 Tax=Chryseobacterium sp. Bi04 TaxID=2822345 RepID=UPI001DCD0FCD|nr:ATP-binding protein [Chryseobacterium sp. Bi04]CAH0169630.1 Oxygen sensor histidine kinase NreB [Chryseobacterium sp. Bi04]